MRAFNFIYSSKQENHTTSLGKLFFKALKLIHIKISYKIVDTWW